MSLMTDNRINTRLRWAAVRAAAACTLAFTLLPYLALDLIVDKGIDKRCGQYVSDSIRANAPTYNGKNGVDYVRQYTACVNLDPFTGTATTITYLLASLLSLMAVGYVILRTERFCHIDHESKIQTRLNQVRNVIDHVSFIVWPATITVAIIEAMILLNGVYTLTSRF